MQCEFIAASSLRESQKSRNSLIPFCDVNIFKSPFIVPWEDGPELLSAQWVYAVILFITTSFSTKEAAATATEEHHRQSQEDECDSQCPKSSQEKCSVAIIFIRSGRIILYVWVEWVDEDTQVNEYSKFDKFYQWVDMTKKSDNSSRWRWCFSFPLRTFGSNAGVKNADNNRQSPHSNQQWSNVWFCWTVILVHCSNDN